MPTERAARIALRTQQVIAHESGVVQVADPLGGSWFVEELTDELEREAEDTFAYLRDQGDGSMLDGVLRAIEQGWFQGQIAEAAYDFQRRVNSGEFVVVGVNDHVDGNDAGPPTLSIDPAVEVRQLERLRRGEGGPRRRPRALVARSRSSATPPIPPSTWSPRSSRPSLRT